MTRRLFACEVTEGDVVSTRIGPRPVESVVRIGDCVSLWFPRVPGLDVEHRLDVDAAELLEIRDAVVQQPEPSPSHEEMLAAVNDAGWATVPSDREVVAWQFKRLTEVRS